jgi:hypothetical protein
LNLTVAVSLQSKKKFKSKALSGDPMGRPFFMKSLQFRYARSPLLFVVVLILVCLSACSPVPTQTPFRPPTAQAPLIEPTFIIQPTQEIVVIESTSQPTIFPTTNPAECSNDLTFLEDLTIPDNMFATFGLTLDKQWLVENSGTCHWNSAYRLRNIGGAALGAPGEIALFPARAGSQATLRILFTAPFTEGVYESAWQAIDANGNPFGDPIYIRIAVQ